MIHYEFLMLARPDITSDEAAGIEKHFDTQLAAHKGKALLFDRWGKYHLAYPVRKNKYGVYLLARIEISETETTPFLKDMQTYFKIKVHDVIMRHVVKRLESDTPLTYEKPDSVEAREGERLDPSLDKIAASLKESTPKAAPSTDDKDTKDKE